MKWRHAESFGCCPRGARRLLAAVVALSGVTLAQPALGQTPAQRAWGDLRAVHPEVEALWRGEGPARRAWMVYGRPMTHGATADEAAEDWLALYGDAFGVEGADLRLWRRQALPSGKTVFAYEQYLDGLPVLGSRVKVVTLEREGHNVILASANVVRPPAGGFPPRLITAEMATTAAAAHPGTTGYGRWESRGQAIIQHDFGRGGLEPVAAWELLGVPTDGRFGPSMTVFVDATTGAVLRIRINELRSDITGIAAAWVTPAPRPDLVQPLPAPWENCSENLPTLVVMPDVLVQASRGGVLLDSRYTALNGTYKLTVSGTEPVDVTARLVGPGWAVWDNHDGSPEPVPALLQVVSPGGVANFTFNATQTELSTAHVNVHHAVSNARRIFKDRMPPGEDPVLDGDLLLWTNDVVQTCQALSFFYYTPPIITLSRAATGCLNAGFSQIAVHEYGHLIMGNLLGVPDWVSFRALHEGYGDTLGIIAYDESAYVYDWHGCGVVDRQPIVDNYQYPHCDSNAYARGEVLSAVWIRIRQGLGGAIEPTLDLLVEWGWLLTAVDLSQEACGVTEGRDQSAHEGTLVEVLTADDDDGDLSNSTPNGDVICAAFAAHNIMLSDNSGGCGYDSAPYKPLDMTGDGDITELDLLIFQQLVLAGDPIADLNQDGVADIFDLLEYMQSYQCGQ
ncbi:MAG: GC-type dockerin domain-anchored protein [Phycisphaerales bacterium JB039]